MLTYCMRRQVLISNRVKTKLSVLHHLLWRHSSTTDEGSDPASVMLELLQKRFFIPPDHGHAETFMRGRSSAHGPLGVDLKRNILEQWWTSVVRSRPQVYGISSLHWAGDEGAGNVDVEVLDLLNQSELSKDQPVARLKHGQGFRSSLLRGALEQYLPSLDLMNRRLPFGLAETGLCYRPETTDSDAASDRSSEVMEASLVWFCSPRTSSQWLDYWTRQRLQWWRKFAVGPSDFSVQDASDEELSEGATRGVKVLYRFPWGPQALETLRSLGDAELLRIHKSSRAKLRCKDGKKTVVPHVLSLSANMDRGVLAVLFNSLQHVQKVDSKQRRYQRTVLKLHPTVAPVKVALDMGRGSSSELRRVCEGLLQDFLEVGISVWPGYLDSMQCSTESLHTKYDEMGVVFTVMVGENTLENGLVLVRSRDTTVRETMHVSELRAFLLKYISAARND